MPRRTDSYASSFPITIYRGAACSQTFQLLNPDGSDMVITDFIFTLILTDVFNGTYRLSSEDAPTTNGSQISITDGPHGIFKFTIADEDTPDATLGKGRWAIQVDEGDGFPYILYKDVIYVEDI